MAPFGSPAGDQESGCCGWITETYSWHWLFLINIIPGVVAWGARGAVPAVEPSPVTPVAVVAPARDVVAPERPASPIDEYRPG